MKFINVEKFLGRDAAAFISLVFGIFNLFVASGLFDRLFWNYLETGFGLFFYYFFIMGMILGIPLGKYGLSSKYKNYAIAGCLMTFCAFCWMFWSVWQTRNFHIY
ncbi:MAG: hypothetical protein MUD10_03910 [Candidatus Pacebacteria bacterium]|nr:hypothetical protein [Candidatus Paceibacterota bacterium]